MEKMMYSHLMITAGLFMAANSAAAQVSVSI
jgi:hypothetical protein